MLPISHKCNIHEKQLQIALMQFILPSAGKKLYTEVKLKEAEHPCFINDEIDHGSNKLSLASLHLVD